MNSSTISKESPMPLNLYFSVLLTFDFNGSAQSHQLECICEHQIPIDGDNFANMIHVLLFLNSFQTDGIHLKF